MGQAYLVLEWVQGQRIDDHCDALQMGLRERISLSCTLLGDVTHAASLLFTGTSCPAR